MARDWHEKFKAKHPEAYANNAGGWWWSELCIAVMMEQS